MRLACVIVAGFVAGAAAAEPAAGPSPAASLPASIAPLDAPPSVSPSPAAAAPRGKPAALSTLDGPAGRISASHDAAGVLLHDDALTARLREATAGPQKLSDRLGEQPNVAMPAADAQRPVPPGGGNKAAAKPDGDGGDGAAAKAVPARPVTSADRAALRIKVRTQALKLGLPPQIADAVAEVESGYNSSAVGSAGEVGLMQVLPSTARMLGFAGTDAELALAENSIRYGVTYLARAWQLASRDICTTVMKYRAGHGETRFSVRSVDYCRRVRAVLASQGYPVTGELPEATFGEPAAAGAEVFPVPRAAVGGRPRGVARGMRRPGSAIQIVRDKGGRVVATGRRRGRIDWAAADERMRAITSKVSSTSLLIAR